MQRWRSEAIGRCAVFTLSACLLAHAAAAQDRYFDDESSQGYEYEGPYGQFGVAVGQIDFDGANIDNNASGGFTLTAGYRALPWLSAEANFTYLAGGDVEFRNNDIGDGEFWAFTFGPKFYPLGAFETDAIPEFVQPYGLIAIGGGEFEIDDTSFDESAFVARFILGFDVWATDHLGFFVEGGGHATDEDDVDGVGIFTVGGQYRF